MLSHFSRVRLCVTPQTAATRLPRPWDSPGKTTGVGCHFLLQCMKVKSESEVAQSPPWTAAYQAPPSMGFSRQKSIQVNKNSFETLGIKYVPGFTISSVLKTKFSLCTVNKITSL